jgi:hypothetical protein
MLSEQTIHDLELSKIASILPLKTSWGSEHFTSDLQSCNSSHAHIKRRQLPLLALRGEPAVCASIQSELQTLNTPILDDSLHVNDSRIADSVSQVLWKPDSFGAFLNSSPLILKSIITWKTLILPGFAVLMPLFAFIVPFFVLRFIRPSESLSTHAYLERLKHVLLQQVKIPSFLKSRGDHDRIGFILESFFIALTLAMFVSSLWNQVTSAMNLRSIWHDLEYRGGEIQRLRSTVASILEKLKALPPKKAKALKYILMRGEAAYDASANIRSLNGVSTFGTVWSTGDSVKALKAWIAEIDVYVAIASTPSICFPRITPTTQLVIQDVIHPLCKSCVANNLSTSSHVLLTGPNRGGKSTFCKSVGLAVVTAQSWGFAWASSMSWSPYRSICTALEPYGRLGEYSTFEAEIDFAKQVLSVQDTPVFVMMDEIFHSTNAADGLAASSVFLSQLYAKPHTISIVSTHYKTLAESYTESATPLCMIAHTVGADGELQYTYKVGPGISEKSSVMEILRERGLLRASVPGCG